MLPSRVGEVDDVTGNQICMQCRAAGCTAGKTGALVCGSVSLSTPLRSCGREGFDVVDHGVECGFEGFAVA
jgi:hypothetical protein